MNLLRELGLKKVLDNVEHAPIHSAILNFLNKRHVILNTPLDQEQGRVCKRNLLDNELFTKAKEVCDTRQGFKVKELIQENGRVTGIKGEGQNFTSACVILADGAHSALAKKIGADSMDPKHTAVSIRTYFQGVKTKDNCIEMHFLKELLPGYFWIFPTGGKYHEVNVGLILPSQRVRNEKKTMKEHFEDILQSPDFYSRFTQAERNSPIEGWSLPLGSEQRQLVYPGALLVGDAAGLINPLTGEGIGYSMTSGKIAAEVLSTLLQKGLVSDEGLQSYSHRLRSKLKKEHKSSYFLQKLFTYPRLINFCGFLLKNSNYLRNKLYHAVFLNS